MKDILDWIVARLYEPSTWAGLGVGAVAVGAALQSNAGIVAALFAGAVAIVMKESK